MKLRTMCAVLAVTAAMAVPTLGGRGDDPQPAAEAVARAHALLARGEFGDALEAYADAIRANPQNQELKQRFAVLRQVIRVRELHAGEARPETKRTMARALRAFYYDNALFGEALRLDRQTHESEGTAESAADLAESQLELRQNTAVVELLTGLGAKEQTDRTRTLLAIALLREGETGKAKAIAETIRPPEKDDPGRWFELACMYSLLGEQTLACDMLTRSFQMTRPPLLEQARARAMCRPDLRPLVDSGVMRSLLTVESRVTESACSGTASCAGCSSADNCSSGSGQTAGSDKGGGG